MNNKFAFAVKAHVLMGNQDKDMITKLFCWHNPHSSFYGKMIEPSVFAFECDCEMMELNHMQFMAMCEGPDIKDTVNILNYGVNIKDIHVTTGRIAVIDLLRATPGVRSESFDSAQRNLRLVLETHPLPKDLQGKYASQNRQSVEYITAMAPKLHNLDQERVDALNDHEVQIADEANIMIAKNGMRYHKEGVLGGACLTIWNNTVDLSMVYLQNALNNKIERHFACPADGFGLVMTCLKICGVGIHETIDSKISDQFMRSFPCMISSAITYASDLKKNPIDGSFEMSEDISTPMSDNVYEEKGYTTRMLLSKGMKVNGNGMKGIQRTYHDSIFYDDCEGDASILKICFGMVQKLCNKVGGMGEKELSSFAGDIKQFGIMKEWSLNDIRDGLAQCKQLSQHIKSSDIHLLLMSAKAPNVEKSEEQNADSEGNGEMQIVYDICGHCAAMTKHNGSFSLAEMTAPVYMVPFEESHDATDSAMPKAVVDMFKRCYSTAMQKRMKLRGQGPGDIEITEDMLYNTISNELSPAIPPSKTWMHMKNIDDVFWHVGGILGNKMLIAPDKETIGIPIKDLIKPGMVDKVQALNIKKTKEEEEEFNFITTYATPPILPYVKVFQSTVSPPLRNSVYQRDVTVIPIVYAAWQDNHVEKIKAWVKQDPSNRYTCKIGKSVLGVLAIPRCNVESIKSMVSSQRAHSGMQRKFCIK